jgi:hypothetical protein
LASPRGAYQRRYAIAFPACKIAAFIAPGTVLQG